MGQIIWSPGISLDAMEKMIILAAWRHFQKNKEMTCRSLGIAVRTLEYKLKQYDEEEQCFKQAEAQRKEHAEKLLYRQRFGDRIPEQPANPIPPPPPTPVSATTIQVTNLKKRSK